MFFWYRAKKHGFWIEITSFHCCRLPFRSYKPLYVFWGRSGGAIIRVSGTAFALEVFLGRGWRLCGGEKYILVFMTSCSLSSGITLICPGSRTKKGARSVDGFRCCSSFSACWLIIQCWWATHWVLMSRSLSIFMKNESNRLNFSALYYGKNARHAYLGRAGLSYLWNPRRWDFIHAVWWL